MFFGGHSFSENSIFFSEENVDEMRMDGNQAFA